VTQVRVIRAIARLNVGGPAWHAVLLTAGTRARYPTLLAIGQSGAHEGDASALAEQHGAGDQVIRVPGLGRDIGLLGDLRALWTLWRLCRQYKPDIVHTHTAKAGALGRLAAWLAGVPVRVHTFHGHVFHGYFARWKTALYIRVERALARITTRIVAISARQARELREYLRLAADRISVIPLGFDLRRFQVAERQAACARFRAAIGARPDQTVITMVGRLTAIKNHPLAFAALAGLGRPDVLLVLVGGGEEAERLRALARSLGIERQVRFAGWWHDLEAVYYGSDIVALSSDNEGTPVCLIEALACGRAVVATDVGGVADVLEEGRRGLLVPPGRVDAFAEALRRLLDPAERARYEAADAAAVVERYGITRLVADVEALYDELLTQHPSRRKSSSMRSAQTV